MITPAYLPSAQSPLYITPSSIFTGAVDGVWYDPSDLSTLFQDSAGTTPVTADGDPVGLMLDKSGNGFHAVQATAGNRPVYKTDGVLHWLELTSASSQYMTHTANAPETGDFLTVFAYETTTNTGNPFIAWGAGLDATYTGFSFDINDFLYVKGSDATGGGNLMSLAAGLGYSANRLLWSFKRSEVYSFGVQYANFLDTLGTKNLNNANKRLFCYYTFTNQLFMNGKFFGGVYVKGATTTQQRQIAQYYLAQKSRIATA